MDAAVWVHGCHAAWACCHVLTLPMPLLCLRHQVLRAGTMQEPVGMKRTHEAGEHGTSHVPSGNMVVEPDSRTQEVWH
jgi:hypothetical protein